LWTQLSYAQFANAFDRGVALDEMFGRVCSCNPDLSAFKARGGKFLSWHGWNDESIPVQHSMHFYDDVVRKMGGLASVQSFFKLYLVPGGGHTSPHGTSNPDANPPAVAGGQMYKLLVDWVEKNIEPSRVEIESPKPTGKITQPICPYPQQARYQSGDPRVTTSFRCL
jgi:Tannase and feruloyl esterase